MRRLILALALVSTASAALAHDTYVQGDECTRRNFRFDGDDAYVREETLTTGNLRSIKAAVSHSPMSVIGGGSGYSIKVCKAAAVAADLDDIRVTYEGGELRATGPDHRRWTVAYIVRVPRNADVDVSTSNGPLSVRDVDGRVEVSAENGPLSLRNVSGNVNATTANGPISVHGGSGTVKVRASNGPLSIKLPNGSWQGGSLDAATRNGPLSVNIPRGYGSSIVVEGQGGPVSCKAEGCAQYRGSWSEEHGNWRAPRKFEFGSGPSVVRISTVNGPLTIKDE